MIVGISCCKVVTTDLDESRRGLEEDRHAYTVRARTWHSWWWWCAFVFNVSLNSWGERDNMCVHSFETLRSKLDLVIRKLVHRIFALEKILSWVFKSNLPLHCQWPALDKHRDSGIWHLALSFCMAGIFKWEKPKNEY